MLPVQWLILGLAHRNAGLVCVSECLPSHGSGDCADDDGIGVDIFIMLGAQKILRNLLETSSKFLWHPSYRGMTLGSRRLIFHGSGEVESAGVQIARIGSGYPGPTRPTKRDPFREKP